MGLKDAAKKTKEKEQAMMARPYIGIDMAAGEGMLSNNERRRRGMPMVRRRAHIRNARNGRKRRRRK